MLQEYFDVEAPINFYEGENMNGRGGSCHKGTCTKRVPLLEGFGIKTLHRH